MDHVDEAATRVVARLLADAVRDLEQVSATIGVGAVTRPSVPREVVRFAEGRWAALREVDRRAALDGVTTALATVRRDWAQTTTVTGSDPAGDAAYRSGGLASLDQLAAELHP